MSDAPIELPKPSKAALLEARSLQRRKVREELGKFLVEGRKAVGEALKLRGAVEAVYVRWDAAIPNQDLLEAAAASKVPVFAVSEQNLATLTDTVTPQGVVAVARTLSVSLDSVLSESDVSLVVICAQVRDPGNAGTVIRCADAFGADAVILSSDSVEVYNPKVVRSSVGSIFHLPIVTGVSLAQAIDACRAAGLQIFATDGEAGTDLTDLDGALAKPTAWVMGNESWGLPLEHLQLADQTVAVPIYGHAESLNLATAAAVCLYASASAQREALG
ncbi:MAG: RNA methyltransferase [Propionibacteriaceae bacterium]|jgi:TrmH family RNA methyltransferase|nr:RNA methyltransferase [Propionibacteriaceae bacterium]